MVEVKSAKELAEQSDIIFMCLLGSPQIEVVIRGEGGLKEGVKSGSVSVDCSITDPVSTATLEEELSEMGVDYGNAPLGRAPKEAEAGTLDTMIGAKRAVFDRIQPVVDTWADKIVHIGRVGDGHRMKLLNNFPTLGYAALYSEAIVLGQMVGIAPDQIDSVICGSRM